MADYSVGSEQYDEPSVDNFSGANGADIEQRTGDSIVPSDDEEKKKLFVGGLSWETAVKEMREYFSKFGEVVDCTLKTDVMTGRSRGFGFVTYATADSVEKVLGVEKHMLQGRKIDPKRAMPRGTQEPTRKIFVGGLDVDISEKAIRDHFSKFGKVEEIDLPFDKVRNQRRQFCFVTFDSDESVEKAIAEPTQEMAPGKQVDIKRATPKGGDGAGGRARGGYHGAWGDQSYNQGWGSGYDSNSYYNQGGYGGYDYYNQGGYGGYGGYDYNQYYNPSSWGQGQGYGGYGTGYGGYDYSGWYGQNQSQGSSDYTQGSDGQSATQGGSYKAAGKSSTPGSTPGYHPYQR